MDKHESHFFKQYPPELWLSVHKYVAFALSSIPFLLLYIYDSFIHRGVTF